MENGSPIYNAMTSDGNRNSIYVLIGICIPLTIDYILDFFYYGSMDKESGYVDRGILLLNAWVPNLIILFFVIPHKSPIYIPLLHQIRVTVSLFCVLTYLNKFGNAVANGKFFFLICLLSLIGVVTRLFASMSSLVIFSIVWTISIFLLSFMFMIFFIKWILYIRKEQFKNPLTSAHIICSVYLLTIVICLITFILLRLGLGSLIDANSTSTDLIVHQIVLCVLLLALVMIHSRIVRFKMNRTQVIMIISLYSFF